MNCEGRHLTRKISEFLSKQGNVCFEQNSNFVASCQNMRPLLRSLFSVKGLVIVTGLAISGLFMISVLASMDQDSETEDGIPNDILPICDKKTLIRENSHRDILFVSTLDGTLTGMNSLLYPVSRRHYNASI